MVRSPGKLDPHSLTGFYLTLCYQGWANNATLGVAGPIIVDGAKRDRAVWPGQHFSSRFA